MRNDLNVSVGPLLSKKRTQDGVILYTENCSIEIKVFSESVFRITVSKEDSNWNAGDFSYAVKAKAKRTKFVFFEQDDNIFLETDLIKLVIHCTPIRLKFFDKNGKLISEEDKSFGTSWIGTQVTTYKKLQENEKFIGLGEKTGNLNRSGSAYINWNTDQFAYSTNADPLYLSVPFYIGIHHDIVYGIYLDNSSKSVFNFGASNNRFSYFSTEFGNMRYFFIHDINIRKIIEAYTWLTGRIQLPPIWSLGYHQCRYSYMTSDEVIRIAKTFREKKIPCDVIYLDIHHMNRYKSFTWDGERFKNPELMLQKLKKLGFKVVTIINPGVKIEENYHVYESGKANSVFIKYPDNEDYIAEVWPGFCVFPDFTNPEVRLWWGRILEDFINIGIEGFWNDMNEPASWGQCVPELLEFDYDGLKASHKVARNVYGMQMARSTYEGAKKIMKNKRPFILSRAGFAGIQNYSATWTGDNVSSDDHMLLGVRLLNSLGLSGIAFAGNDIAGFEGEATPKLFARWISTGVFTPLVRGHSMFNSRAAEPWCFGEEVEIIARKFIQLRYKLLPYIYSSFYECTKNGMPIVRSLAIDYTDDPKVYKKEYQNQYLFGDFILVSPANSSKDITKIYLPKGNWYDFYTDKLEIGHNEIFVETPLSKIPLFIKEGAIIPVQSKIGQNSTNASDSISFHIYRGKSDSSYEYYEDDGISFEYEKSIFYKRQIFLNNERLVFKGVIGSYESQYKYIEILFHGFKFEDKKNILVNNQKVKLKKKLIHNFIPSLTENVNISDSDHRNSIRAHSILIENVSDEIFIPL